ncbi:hypothetical protein JB92DRAFT_3119487 [Gautieria morchelliformis]|nr:hypothetical protein JB92DRAFT_3119487 [Gautieria morchelliformis]
MNTLVNALHDTIAEGFLVSAAYVRSDTVSRGLGSTLVIDRCVLQEYIDDKEEISALFSSKVSAALSTAAGDVKYDNSVSPVVMCVFSYEAQNTSAEQEDAEETVYSADGEASFVVIDDDVCETIEDTQTLRLQRNIVAKGGLCCVKGITIVYVPTVRRWFHIASVAGMKYIATVIGAENATMNFQTAAAPFMNYLIQSSTAYLCDLLPASVCVSSGRYQLETTDRGVARFVEQTGLAPKASWGTRSTGLCLMPVSCRIRPKEVKSNVASPVMSFIGKMLDCKEDLLTFMWVLGTALLDPVVRSKGVLLYGPGGTGKSTLIKLVRQCLGECTTVIPSNALEGRRPLSDHVKIAACSNRILLCPEANITMDFNIANFKALCGLDIVASEYIPMISVCSLILACNYLPDPKRHAEWYTTAFSRHAIVIPMYFRVAEHVSAFSSIMLEELDKMTFVTQCILVANKYNQAPNCIRTLLLTIMGELFAKMLDGRTTSLFSEASGMKERLTKEFVRRHTDPSVMDGFVAECLRGMRDIGLQQTSQGDIGAMTREARLYASCFGVEEEGALFVATSDGRERLLFSVPDTRGHPCLRAVALLASGTQQEALDAHKPKPGELESSLRAAKYNMVSYMFRGKAEGCLLMLTSAPTVSTTWEYQESEASWYCIVEESSLRYVNVYSVSGTCTPFILGAMKRKGMDFTAAAHAYVAMALRYHNKQLSEAEMTSMVAMMLYKCETCSEFPFTKQGMLERRMRWSPTLHANHFRLLRKALPDEDTQGPPHKAETLNEHYTMFMKDATYS